MTAHTVRSSRFLLAARRVSISYLFSHSDPESPWQCMGYVVLRRTRQKYRAIQRKLKTSYQVGIMTDIVICVVRENLKVLLQKGDHMICHFCQFMIVAIRIDVTKPRTHWVVDEQQVGKFVPCTVIIFQMRVVLHPVRSYLHQSSIHRTASRSSIHPYDGTVAVCKMSVLKVPEEQVSIMLRDDFDVPIQDVRRQPLFWVHRLAHGLPCVHIE